jgi:hypothetical protein
MKWPRTSKMSHKATKITKKESLKLFSLRPLRLGETFGVGRESAQCLAKAQRTQRKNVFFVVFVPLCEI